jgi:hypothetical protein
MQERAMVTENKRVDVFTEFVKVFEPRLRPRSVGASWH